jgi:hypothetical protein
VKISLEEVKLEVSGRHVAYKWERYNRVWKSCSGSFGLIMGSLSTESLDSLKQATVRPEGGAEPVYIRRVPGEHVFEGVDVDGGVLSVALGEFREMFKRPSSRPYIGYVM